MRKLLIFLLSLFALCTLIGCGSIRKVQTIPVETITQVTKVDTVYLNAFRFDSTYVSHDLLTDRSKDTILIRETNTEIRFQILRDTIERVKLEVVRDSIPYEVRITETKEVKYIPWWIKALTTIGAMALTLMVVSLIFKIAKL